MPARSFMTWVKICATTNLADAMASVEAGADALGFIFAESRRRVTPQAAREMVAALPERVEKIGLFADEELEVIWRTVREVGLTGVQFHGHETVRLMRRFVQLGEVEAAGIHAGEAGAESGFRKPRLVKAIPVAGDPYSAGRWIAGAEDFLDAVLLDSSRPGGSGKTFDWTAAQEFALDVGQRYRLIVAGGLTPENVTQAIEILRPWGVDVVSGVEREPGKKDHAKLKAFIAAAKGSPVTAGGSPGS